MKFLKIKIEYLEQESVLTDEHPADRTYEDVINKHVVEETILYNENHNMLEKDIGKQLYEKKYKKTNTELQSTTVREVDYIVLKDILQ